MPTVAETFRKLLSQHCWHGGMLTGFARLAELIGGTEDEHFQRVVDVLHAHREELGL